MTDRKRSISATAPEILEDMGQFGMWGVFESESYDNDPIALFSENADAHGFVETMIKAGDGCDLCVLPVAILAGKLANHVDEGLCLRTLRSACPNLTWHRGEEG